MSVIHIPDDVLAQAGISEQEARLELACRLFETGKLALHFAAKLADLPQGDFEDVLLDRGIPIYRYSEADLAGDLKSIRTGK